MSARTRLARRVGRVLAGAVIVCCCAALALGVVVPRVAGATPYAVLTGSMRPHLPPGTLVVTRPTPAERIQAGSVVTYQLHSGDPTVVTHRVVAVRTGPRGGRELQTRGDANAAPDPAWVRAEQVRGTLWYAVPELGRVGALVPGPRRSQLVDLIALALLGYAGVVFAGEVRTRLVRARPGEAQR